MSIADKLTQLNEIKQDIKQAIIDKGQAATDDMGEYSTLISNISGGCEVDDSFKNVLERNNGAVTFPSNLTSIGDYAFDSCANTFPYSLPDGVTSIGINAFYGCTNLALTSLPEGVTSIGSSAFSGCTNLALTSLPEGITKIGGSTFEY